MFGFYTCRVVFSSPAMTLDSQFSLLFYSFFFHSFCLLFLCLRRSPCLCFPLLSCLSPLSGFCLVSCLASDLFFLLYCKEAASFITRAKQVAQQLAMVIILKNNFSLKLRDLGFIEVLVKQV